MGIKIEDFVPWNEIKSGDLIPDQQDCDKLYKVFNVLHHFNVSTNEDFWIIQMYAGEEFILRKDEYVQRVEIA